MGKPAPVLRADGSMTLGARASREWDGPSSALDFQKVMRDVKHWWDNYFRFDMKEFSIRKEFYNPDNPCLEATGELWSSMDKGAKERITRAYIQERYSSADLRLWRDETVITEAQMREDAGLPRLPTTHEKGIVARAVGEYAEKRKKW